jgi:low affinity Fe/Cu permease
LVVFLIRNTQNRDTRAIHLKLDEIIKSIDQAKNEMIDIEHLSDAELQELAEVSKMEECDREADAPRRKAEIGRVNKFAVGLLRRLLISLTVVHRASGSSGG